jgi:hypothetical protein
MRWTIFWTIKVQFPAKNCGFHTIYFLVDVGVDLIVDKAAREWLTCLYARSYSPVGIHVVEL